MLLGLGFSPHTSAQEVHKLRVCLMSSDLFPLWRKAGSENLEYGGINIDLMRAIFVDMDIELEWERAPFARCLHYLQSGTVDVLNVASYRKEREVYGVFPKTNGKIDTSRRFKYDTYYAFVKRGSEVIFTGEEFLNTLGLPIAVEVKASVIPLLESYHLDLLTQPSSELAFEMLKIDRVAAVVTNQYNGLKYSTKNIRRIEPPVVEKPYYLVFSKQFYEANTNLAERIWFLSGQLQARKYQNILQRYASLSYWPEEIE